MNTDIDLTKEADVVEYMKAVEKGSKEWNQRCDDVKAANGGYPSFWYNAIIVGLNLPGPTVQVFSRRLEE